jgi:hypothetical protein
VVTNEDDDGGLALHADDRLLDRLAGLGMDCGDLKRVNGRLTLWCGGTEEGLAKVRAAIPWVSWELVGGRAAVIP